jgi:hypothetical protein
VIDRPSAHAGERCHDNAIGRSRSPLRTGVKRGWADMTALLDKGSSGDDDFARLFARLDEATGVSDQSVD